MLSGLALRREPELGADSVPGSEPGRRLSCTSRGSPRRRHRPPHTTGGLSWGVSHAKMALCNCITVRWGM